MAPVLFALRKRASVEPIVCFTGQHRELLAQASEYFGLRPDFNLDLMRPNQGLNGLLARCLEGIDQAVDRYKPSILIAQGDTTTVAAASIVGFHRRVPFAHVEAGLRTNNLHSPWPEEFNRRVAGISTDIHCAPTVRAANNLRHEGVTENKIHVTGNTVIDALLYTLDRERTNPERWLKKYPQLVNRRMVLITGHRRENHGDVQASLFEAIKRLSEAFLDVSFLFPVHPNPSVQEAANRVLGCQENITLTTPLDYPEFVWLMDRCSLIITDSGGVQEEAPSLGKPVLVTRDTTERPEAIEVGAAKLVGCCPVRLFEAAQKLLVADGSCNERKTYSNPYGDGKAGERIARLVLGEDAMGKAA